MAKINVNELSIRELKELASDFFPEMSVQDINNTSLGVLQSMVCDELQKSTSIDPLGEKEESFELYSSAKHLPSRKKKANRINKRKKQLKYKKAAKEGEVVASHTRKRVDAETTNRSYINKASKRYVPNRALYSKSNSK